MGSSGCAFCADGAAHEKLSRGEVEEIGEILSSLTLDLPFVSTLQETSSVFCVDCHALLKEAKRLQVLLETVTSQLVSLVAKVKVKYDGRLFRVKLEDGDHTNSTRGDASPSGDSKGPPPHKDNRGKDDDSEFSSAEDVDNASCSNDTQEEPLGSRNKNSRRSTSDADREIKGHYWACGFCDLKFLTKDEKFTHDETIHFEGVSDDVEGATRLYSSICGKSSLTPRELTTHNESFHSSHQRFFCLSCIPMRKFFSEDLLTAHNVTHSSSNAPFSCSLCLPSSLSFESACDLDNHLLRLHTHSTKPPKESERAGEECDNPPIPRILGGKKVPPCRFCGVQVPKGQFYRCQHERKEHAEKFTHLCACSLTFAEEKELLTCQETHKEVSPSGQFKCFVCNVKFAEGETLREHFEAKHSTGGVKCDECPERVVSANKLRLHKARVHGGEWPFNCPICGKGARSQLLLEDHIRSAHKDRLDSSALLSCDQCDAKFTRRGVLCRHKREKHRGIVGSFTCERCGKVLKSAQSLDNHTRSHLGVKNHMCHLCPKAFVHPGALKEHLRSHTGEKPYGCHICGGRFTRSLSLKNHLNIHKKNGSWKKKPSKAS